MIHKIQELVGVERETGGKIHGRGMHTILQPALGKGESGLRTVWYVSKREKN